jgi:hypothetical protein
MLCVGNLNHWWKPLARGFSVMSYLNRLNLKLRWLLIETCILMLRCLLRLTVIYEQMPWILGEVAALWSN